VVSRGKRQRFFCAFVLPSTKPKKSAKKAKALSVKEKSANLCFSSSLLRAALETREMCV
jgi:hypothetical protein